MTLTEAYEELLKLHQQRESIRDLNESCIKGDGTVCCMVTENSDHPVYQQFLSDCLTVCLA